MINDLIKISRYAGERFDLIQAGGGNSSVKNNGQMLIKSSGYHLLEINVNTGFSIVDNEKILQILNHNFGDKKKENDKIAAELVKRATISGQRPSIETLLHSMFNKYTLHTHPLSVNVVCASHNCKELLNKIFDKEEILFINYKTPGIELALELKKQMDIFKKNYGKNANIVFLQNHGLIVSSNNIDDIQTITDSVINKIDSFLELDFERYKLTNKISALLDDDCITYYSEDAFLNESLKKHSELFHAMPFCPDKMVYCLADTVKIDSIDDNESILKFKQIYQDTPKVVIYGDKIFLAGPTIKKCKEVEEVLKFHILTLSNISKQNQNLLSPSEIAYLGNWEAEKYRQKL